MKKINVTMIDSITIKLFFFFKQKTAYEMRNSDWSSDVCSSDLAQDGCLRRVDDRGRQHRAESAAIGNREGAAGELFQAELAVLGLLAELGDRKSVVAGKSVSVRVGLGGRRSHKKKKTQHQNQTAQRHLQIN